MIDPLTIAAAGNALGGLQSIFSDDDTSKVSTKKGNHADFDQMFTQQTTPSTGITADQALGLVGANVTVQSSNGSTVTGQVERIELQPEGVSLRVQGHDYLNTQVVKINQLAA